MIPLFSGTRALVRHPANSFIGAMSKDSGGRGGARAVRFALEFSSSITPDDSTLGVGGLGVFVVASEKDGQGRVRMTKCQPARLTGARLFKKGGSTSSLGKGGCCVDGSGLT